MVSATATRRKEYVNPMTGNDAIIKDMLESIARGLRDRGTERPTPVHHGQERRSELANDVVIGTVLCAVIGSVMAYLFEKPVLTTVIASAWTYQLWCCWDHSLDLVFERFIDPLLTSWFGSDCLLLHENGPE